MENQVSINYSKPLLFTTGLNKLSCRKHQRRDEERYWWWQGLERQDEWGEWNRWNPEEGLEWKITDWGWGIEAKGGNIYPVWWSLRFRTRWFVFVRQGEILRWSQRKIRWSRKLVPTIRFFESPSYLEQISLRCLDVENHWPFRDP